MSLKTLRLLNFRSYQDQVFTFSSGVNVIVGANGSGKTNIIEAIYVLGMTKSWRGSSQDLVRNDADWARVEADYNGDIFQLKIKDDKKLLINNKILKPQDFLGRLTVVLFEPGDLAIVDGSPIDRRKFIDTALSAINKQYMLSLLKYRRILRQRNQVLRNKPLREEQIFAWDLLLAREAEIIVKQRRDFISFLSQNIYDTYNSISGSDQQIGLSYRGLGPDKYIDTLLSKLKNNLGRDVVLGSTSCGPHRDDIKFTYDSKSFSYQGSRGETRSLVLALKLLQMRYIRKITKTNPTLLLDDVFSELDEARQLNILKYCGRIQTIITATHIPDVVSSPNIIKLT